MSKEKKADLWRTKKNKDGSLSWEGFPPYNLIDAEKKLEPEEKAANFATSLTTVDDEAELTSEEKKMLAAVNIHVSELGDWFSRRVGAIKDKINSLAKESDLEENLTEISQGFYRDRRLACEKFESEHQDDYSKRMSRYVELRNFQDKNGLLQRRATYPDSTPYHFAIVFAALVGEAVANAYFFGQASATGLLGGFLTAFLVSLANVGFAMLAGVLFLREINHVNLLRKAMGVVMFVVMLAFLAMLHLTIAHYREALTRNPDADIWAVLGPVWENPLGLQDMESLLLIAIGVVISAIAVWKGYTLDDRYPGYGAVYREWEKYDDHMNQLEAELKGDIGEAYDAAVYKTQGIFSKMKASKKELLSLEGDIEANFGCCEAYYNTARKTALSLIGSFRNKLHTLYNDQNRFPLSEDLLGKDGGLEKLDSEEDRVQISTLYAEEKRVLDEAINIFPGKQKDFLVELETERIKSTSSSAIQQTLKKIYDDRVDESSGRNVIKG